MLRWLLPALVAAALTAAVPAFAQTALVLPTGCKPATLYATNGGTQQLTQNAQGELCANTAVTVGGTAVSAAAPMPVTREAEPGVTPVVSGALEASHALKASAGKAWSVYASNLTGGTSGFLVLLNLAAAPVDGAITPLACVPFSGGVAQMSMDGMPPLVFSTGITAVVTSATTCFTKTTGVLTAFISGVVQ